MGEEWDSMQDNNSLQSEKYKINRWQKGGKQKGYYKLHALFKTKEILFFDTIFHAMFATNLST